jgi:hypothetical protein
MEGHEADHSSPSNYDVTNEWSYTSTVEVLVNYTRKTLLYFYNVFSTVVVTCRPTGRFPHDGS